MADTEPFEDVEIEKLKPHPRNYRGHPEDQLVHLVASIKQNGFYKNIVIAREDTILAGHGAVEAAKRVGLTSVPARRLDLDPDSPAALRIVAGDNELMRFAEIDDRLLTELLKEVSADPDGLLGTGYDEMVLANLAMVTRFDSEMPTVEAAAEWAGLIDYTPEERSLKVVIHFRNEDDRQRFVDEFGLRDSGIWVKEQSSRVYSGWWPPQEEVRHDSGLRWSQVE